jgi:hypothetical protein
MLIEKLLYADFCVVLNDQTGSGGPASFLFNGVSPKLNKIFSG